MTTTERTDAEHIAEMVTRWREDAEYLRDAKEDVSVGAAQVYDGLAQNIAEAAHTLEMLAVLLAMEST